MIQHRLTGDGAGFSFKARTYQQIGEGKSARNILGKIATKGLTPVDLGES